MLRRGERRERRGEISSDMGEKRTDISTNTRTHTGVLIHISRSIWLLHASSTTSHLEQSGETGGKERKEGNRGGKELEERRRRRKQRKGK